MTIAVGQMQMSDIRQAAMGKKKGTSGAQTPQRTSLGLSQYDEDEEFRAMMSAKLRSGRAGMSRSLSNTQSRLGGGSRVGKAGTGAAPTTALPREQYVIPREEARIEVPRHDPHPGGYFDKEGTWHPEDPPAKQYDLDEEGNPSGDPWYPVPEQMMYDENSII